MKVGVKLTPGIGNFHGERTWGTSAITTSTENRRHILDKSTLCEINVGRIGEFGLREVLWKHLAVRKVILECNLSTIGSSRSLPCIFTILADMDIQVLCSLPYCETFLMAVRWPKEIKSKQGRGNQQQSIVDSSG